MSAGRSLTATTWPLLRSLSWAFIASIFIWGFFDMVLICESRILTACCLLSARLVMGSLVNGSLLMRVPASLSTQTHSSIMACSSSSIRDVFSNKSPRRQSAQFLHLRHLYEISAPTSSRFSYASASVFMLKMWSVTFQYSGTVQPELSWCLSQC